MTSLNHLNYGGQQQTVCDNTCEMQKPSMKELLSKCQAEQQKLINAYVEYIRGELPPDVTFQECGMLNATLINSFMGELTFSLLGMEMAELKRREEGATEQIKE